MTTSAAPFLAPSDSPGVLFRAIDDPGDGSALAGLYAERVEAYRSWYLRDGDEARPTLTQCRQAIETHMPELAPVHAELGRVVSDGDPIASRMLTLFRPPASLIACSQGVWNERDQPPLLVRNYDYSAPLTDCVVLHSRFLDRSVVGTTDGLWGLCDGMNDAGLAVSLTFGGRVVVGDGFGMPIVIRYILETCDSVQRAREVLTRLPYAQAYNLTLTDSSGDVLTAYLGPDRPASFRRLPVATNHQWIVESWDPAFVASTLEREWWLLRLLDDPDVNAARFCDWFLELPLYSLGHAEGIGTVYTAAYAPSDGSIRHRWPGQEDWHQRLDGFIAGERRIVFPASVPIPVTS